MTDINREYRIIEIEVEIQNNKIKIEDEKNNKEE